MSEQVKTYQYFISHKDHDHPLAQIRRFDMATGAGEVIWANRPDKWDPTQFTLEECMNDEHEISESEALRLIARANGFPASPSPITDTNSLAALPRTYAAAPVAAPIFGKLFSITFPNGVIADVTQRADDCHICYQGHPEHWECGKTLGSAVAAFMLRMANDPMEQVAAPVAGEAGDWVDAPAWMNCAIEIERQLKGMMNFGAPWNYESILGVIEIFAPAPPIVDSDDSWVDDCVIALASKRGLTGTLSQNDMELIIRKHAIFAPTTPAPSDDAAKLAAIQKDLDRANEPWRVKLVLPDPIDHCVQEECSIEDIGHSDRVLIVECEESTKAVGKLAAIRKALDEYDRDVKAYEDGPAVYSGTRISETRWEFIKNIKRIMH